MQCKLDWFSFTFPIGQVGDGDGEFELGKVLMSFHDFTLHRFLGIVTNALWSVEQGTGFYKHRLRCPITGMTISWSPYNQYSLVELSGQAVDKILLHMNVSDLVLASNGRATRVDLAVDFECDISPSEFVAERGNSRIIDTGNRYSATGETEYIGSRSSDRMSRVYRYYPPHPRAHLLRVEGEFKGDSAKAVAAELLSSDLIHVTASAHIPFAWQHPIWNVEKMALSKIPARAYDREGAGTLKWLEDSVAPALRRAHTTGLIDLAMWLDKNFDDILKD